MIQVLVGSNWFGIKSELNGLISEFKNTNGELAIERLDGDQNSQAEFLSAINSVSLFAENKLVVIENLSSYKDLVEDLNKFFDTVDQSITLVVVEKQVDKRSSYYKTLKKLDGFKEFNEPDEQSLAAWIINFVIGQGGEISMSDSSYLLDRVGPNQTILEREITKLLAYNKKIVQENIELLCEASPRSKIFDLVDSVFSGNLNNAMIIYDEQRAQRVEPQAILGMLVWQMHLVAVCSVSSLEPSELSRETGLNNYSLSKAKRIADRMRRSGVERFLDLLSEIEITSRKQTYNLDDGLKMAIVSLAN